MNPYDDAPSDTAPNFRLAVLMSLPFWLVVVILIIVFTTWK